MNEPHPEVAAIQTLAQSLPEDAWANGPRVLVDTERALAAVLARADAPPLPLRPRPFAGERVLRAVATLAAALLLFSLAGPVFLRQRIESGSDRPSAAAWVGVGPAQHTDLTQVLFWTTSSTP